MIFGFLYSAVCFVIYFITSMYIIYITFEHYMRSHITYLRSIISVNIYTINRYRIMNLRYNFFERVK